MIKMKKLLYKKRTYFTIAVVALIVVIISSITIIPQTINRHTDFEDIIKRDTLFVAAQLSPMSVDITGNDTTGYSYTLIKEFARHHGLTLVIKTTDNLKEETEILENGECDIIADIIPHTKETKEMLQLSTPVCNSHAVIMQNKNSTRLVTLPSQLTDREIVMPENSPYKIRIINMEHELQDTISTIEIGEKSLFEIVEKLESNKNAIIICDNLNAKHLKKTNKGIVTMTVGMEQNNSFGLDKKSKVLADSLNTWLTDFMQTKEYERIYKEYF